MNLLEGERIDAILNGSQFQADYMRGSVVDEVVNGFQFDPTNTWTNYTFHHDALQSVVGLSSHDGGILQTISYDPFGNMMTNIGAGSNNSLYYTGREQDPDSGLYYYRARYYDPTMGRFLTEDPKGFKAGVNFYTYVKNNPANANDPTGNVALIDNLIGAGIAGGVDLAAQYTQAKIAGQPFQVDWTRTAVATGAGFVTSGLSTLVGGGVEALELGAVSSFALRTAGNTVVGAGVNVAQTATLNDLEGKNDSLGTAALWGGSFGGAGSAVADIFPAVNTAMNGAKLDALSPGEYNFLAGFADLNGLKLGGASPTATAFGTQFGNAVSSLTAFNPGDSGSSASTSDAAGGGFLIYPNKPNNNMMGSVYSK